MKKLSQKSSLLFGVMFVVCALLPSLASAASWSPVGTTHQLFSNNLQFIAHTGPLGMAGSSCAGSEFHADVASAGNLVITSSRFSNCSGLLGAAGCAATVTSTGVWNATAVTTTNIQIHNVIVDVVFNGAAGTCAAPGAKVLLTGTLSGGVWTAGTSNEAVFTNATGLTAHYTGLGAVVNSTTTVTGTIRDTTNTLRVLD